MNYIKRVLLLIIISAGGLSGQVPFPDFYMQNDFLLASPGALKYGLYGYDNPALLNYVDGFDLLFTWSDEGPQKRVNNFNRYGVFTAVKNLGFGFVHNRAGAYSETDYKVSLGTGSRVMSLGFAYGWSSGDTRYFNRRDIITAGILYRPMKYLSFGITGTTTTEKERMREAYMELAVRPLGNELITLFGEFLLRDENRFYSNDDLWGAGLAVEPLPGLRITGRYNSLPQVSYSGPLLPSQRLNSDKGRFSAGIQIGLGYLGLSAQSYFNNNSKHSYNTYGIRLGTYDRNLLKTFAKGSDFLKMDLNRGVKYQRFLFFDNSNTLRGLIRQIEAAKKDPSVSGIAVNTSGMEAGREMLWELRERLRDFRTSGKKVVVFIDRAGMDAYHFATAADKIVMDPLGMITLQGYVAGRTFLKGTLEKLGLGFDEWRFFKYKSAYEELSRERMSEADKIQRQELIDDFYSLARTDISSARGISAEEFDRIVNETAVIMPEEALSRKLVDTLARWDDSGELIKKITGVDAGITGAGSLDEFRLPEDNHWGEFDRIAVIYAIGSTDMDQGITARKLVKYVDAARDNPLIKAVVLRVDSPGGDAMASDYIAEAMKKLSERKPVIVSQGAVAASGGYWLSMYADTIIAAPNTITGSIGVIGGWIYNRGFSEKLGMTTDYVKKGEHAELGFGATLPLIGVSIPDRNLTPEERKVMESYIKKSYEGFVARVAEGRRLSPSYVDSVGQGRVWSGTDGKDLKLVDILGGLNDAIKIAGKLAGIPENEKIRIVEYPEMPMFNLSLFQPRLFGIRTVEDPLIKDFIFRLKYNGQPLMMLPFDYMDLVK